MKKATIECYCYNLKHESYFIIIQHIIILVHWLQTWKTVFLMIEVLLFDLFFYYFIIYQINSVFKLLMFNRIYQWFIKLLLKISNIKIIKNLVYVVQ